MIEGRFIVEIRGSGVRMRALKGALNKMDLNRLASMKDMGVTPE